MAAVRPPGDLAAGTAAGGFGAVEAAVRAGVGRLYPGAVLMVTHRGRIAHAAALGHAQVAATGADGVLRPLPRPRPMRLDTPFDIASVTKVVTASAVAQLVDRGALALGDRLGTLLPRFATTDKAGISMAQLLAHRGGLWEWQPAWLHGATPQQALAFLAALPRRYPIGARHAYSDIGFLLLGEIVARAAGRPLAVHLADTLFRPLGLADTGFRPAGAARACAAATSPGDGYQRRMAEVGEPFPAGPIAPAAAIVPAYRHHVLVGEANDANAALAWGGVAGHAGLFSTAADLLRLAQAWLEADPRLAPAATLRRFEATPFDADQALGWRVSHAGGMRFFAHPGFTGTFLAYSREGGLGVALLTNRLHRAADDGAPPPPLADLQACVLAGLAAAVRSMAGDPAAAEREKPA